MLPVGDNKGRKVIPEVVVAAFCYRSVIVNPLEKGRLGCLADIIWLVIAEENVDARFLQALLDRVSAFEIEY
jgi:hypothetical protein